MKKVEAFKCDYCHRCFGRPCDAKRHEIVCINNPKRKACKTCIHGGFKKAAEEEELDLGGEVYLGEELYCLLLGIPMRDKPYFEECDTFSRYGQNDTPVPFTCCNYEYAGG